MEKGKIIFINGVSSAGKSTLVRALQRKLPTPYFCIALDTFTDIIAPCDSGEFNGEDPNILFEKAITAMNCTIKLYSDLGNNVIVDNVMLTDQKSLLEECADLLYEYSVLFVKVTCPLTELRRRETNRGDRIIGQAESQIPLLFPQESYDITVDTYISTTEECADQIIDFINNNEDYSAFKKLNNKEF